MRNFLFFALVVFFMSCQTNRTLPVILVHFDENNLVYNNSSNNTNKTFDFQSRNNQLEFIDGVKDKAIRFDGYSGSAKIQLDKIDTDEGISVGCWIALETYPTHSAGIIALFGDSSWYSVNLDHFGKLGFNSYNAALEKSEYTIEKFRWTHIALTVGDNKINLYVDGNQVLQANKPQSFHCKSLIIGKDIEQNYVHIFPTMHLNGAVDELKLWNTTLTEKDIVFQVNEYLVEGKARLAPNNRFAGDFNRPKYHLLPAANWTNETHGLIYHNGLYHIFNQKNGTNVFLGQINWGHFSSPDLVKWTEHYPALIPEEGYDENGIWSGHVITNDLGEPVIFYTGSEDQVFGMCMATPMDSNLIGWEKHPQNPVILDTPEQYERADFRDPYVWKENDTWFMIVGYGIDKNGERLRGAVLLYRSKDLVNWESLGTLFEGNPAVDSSGVFWEMPVFWKFADKYILLVQPIPYQGVPANSIYWVGTFNGQKFIPDSPVPQNLEIINRLLSPSVNLDENGNTVAIAIIPDLIPAEMQYEQGWTHLFSIPRVWDFVGGSIHQSPHPNLKKLRVSNARKEDVVLEDLSKFQLAKGKQLEIDLHLDASQSEEFGISLGKSPTGEEETRIIFKTSDNKLIIDQSKTSKHPLYRRNNEHGEFKLDFSKPLKLQLFIDGSVVEGFINDRFTFTTRIFPVSDESEIVELFNVKGQLVVDYIDIWTLDSSFNKFDF